MTTVTNSQRKFIGRGIWWVFACAVVAGAGTIIAERALGLPGTIRSIDERAASNEASIDGIYIKLDLISDRISGMNASVSRIDERTRMMLGRGEE